MSAKRRSEVPATFSGRREKESTTTMRSHPAALSARISREPTKPAPPVTRHHLLFIGGPPALAAALGGCATSHAGVSGARQPCWPPDLLEDRVHHSRRQTCCPRSRKLSKYRFRPSAVGTLGVQPRSLFAFAFV